MIVRNSIISVLNEDCKFYWKLLFCLNQNCSCVCTFFLSSAVNACTNRVWQLGFNLRSTLEVAQPEKQIFEIRSKRIVHFLWAKQLLNVLLVSIVILDSHTKKLSIKPQNGQVQIGPGIQWLKCGDRCIIENCGVLLHIKNAIFQFWVILC